MSSVVAEAVKTLSTSVNVSTGLAHPNDMNKAKELFKILHEKGEILLKSDVESGALSHGWSASSADELGSLAQQIGEGKSPRITVDQNKLVTVREVKMSLRPSQSTKRC